MNRGNIPRIVSSVLFAFLLVLTGFCVYQLTKPGLSWEVESITAISVSMSCLVMCLIVYASVLLDRRADTGAYCFMFLVFCEFLLVFGSQEHWYARVAYVSDHWLNIIDYENFLMFPSTVMAFALYQLSILGIRSRIVKGTYAVMLGAFLVFSLAVVANYFTGWMPDISDVIARFEELTELRILPYIGMLALCTVTALVYAPTKKMKAVMVLYLLIPAFTVIFEYPDNAHYGCIASVLMLYFIFGNTFLERGVALAENELELSEQKVALLTSKIEPEFLLESLDSIIAMEGTSPVAKRAINLFKIYFRQNMNSLAEKDPIPVVRELDHVKVYLSLEKLRFKEGLDVKFEITDTSFVIPPMTIQVLVENAVKHGITQREEGGTVVIRTVEYEKSHRILVIDDGMGFDTSAPRDPRRSHIGIDNVIFRLDEMVGGTLEIKSTPGKGTIATINIPKH